MTDRNDTEHLLSSPVNAERLREALASADSGVGGIAMLGGVLEELARRLEDAWYSRGEYDSSDIDVLRCLCGEASIAVREYEKIAREWDL